MDYLKCNSLKIILDENELLTVIYENKTYNHCKIVRCFPFDKTDEFLSICYELDGKDIEIGIIKDLKELDDESKKSVIEDMALRYFIPEIIKIKSKKYSSRFYVFDCITNAGNIKINVNDLVFNIFSHNDKLFIIDANDNYYVINDYQSKKDKHIKFLKGLL